MVKIYGIKACSSVKKALEFLQQNNVEFEFIDIKTIDITADFLTLVAKEVGVKRLVNTCSTAFRNLNDEQKALIKSYDLATILPIVQQNPLLIKRPLLIKDDLIQVGFDVDFYREHVL